MSWTSRADHRGCSRSLTAPPFLQQEPKWPACIKGSQEEDGGGESCSNYLLHWGRRLRQEREMWGRHQSCYSSALPDTQPLLTTTCHCPLVREDKAQVQRQAEDVNSQLLFLQGPSLDNERILKGYFDDRRFLP